MKTHPRRHPVRRAFTIVELLVVAAILVLLMALAVPAFSNMLYSSEQSMSENALRVALTAARDAAARSPRGQDAAAAFFYDPAVGYTIVPYTFAGTLHDATGGLSIPGSPGATIPREVFAPVPGYEPVHLSRGWMVRGYVPPGAIDDQWYGSNPSLPNNPYDLSTVRQRGNWVFPETAFYNLTSATEGRNRQTFIMRFEGGTGMLLPPDGKAVLLLAPAPTQQFRTGNLHGRAAFRPDRESDGPRFIRRVLASSLTLSDLQRLLGDLATDTVLAKPVSHLALYNERALVSALAGAGLEARLNRDSRSLYFEPLRPSFIPPSANGDLFVDRLSQWLENRLNAADSDARIFTVHRYLGSLQDVSGTSRGS
jgi:type II secretory pathway pseudopilin PulG